jgi:hypothetical protein
LNIDPDVRERILAAAHELYEQNGQRDFPTLDSVRKRSRTNMADASAVMKEWRRLQTAQPVSAVPAVPDRVQRAAEAASTALWADAQAVAKESLTVGQAAWAAEGAQVDAERRELSAAFDAQGAELESLRASLSEMAQATAAATVAQDQERLASEARVAALSSADRSRPCGRNHDTGRGLEDRPRGDPSGAAHPGGRDEPRARAASAPQGAVGLVDT